MESEIGVCGVYVNVRVNQIFKHLSILVDV